MRSDFWWCPQSRSPTSQFIRQPQREPDAIEKLFDFRGRGHSRDGAAALRSREPSQADSLLRLVPSDAAVVVTIEGLRDQSSAFFKSHLAAELRRLPAVQGWFASAKHPDLSKRVARSRL